MKAPASASVLGLDGYIFHFSCNHWKRWISTSVETGKFAFSDETRKPPYLNCPYYNPPAVIEQRAPGARALLLCGSSQFVALWLAAQATTTHSALGPMQRAFVFTGNSTVPTEVAVLAAFSRSSVTPPLSFLSLFYWSWSGRRANAVALLSPPPRRLCQR